MDFCSTNMWVLFVCSLTEKRKLNKYSSLCFTGTSISASHLIYKCFFMLCVLEFGEFFFFYVWRFLFRFLFLSWKTFYYVKHFELEEYKKCFTKKNNYFSPVHIPAQSLKSHSNYIFDLFRNLPLSSGVSLSPFPIIPYHRIATQKPTLTLTYKKKKTPVYPLSPSPYRQPKNPCVYGYMQLRLKKINQSGPLSWKSTSCLVSADSAFLLCRRTISSPPSPLGCTRSGFCF